jgi:hypothetical protein
MGEKKKRSEEDLPRAGQANSTLGFANITRLQKKKKKERERSHFL